MEPIGIIIGAVTLAALSYAWYKQMCPPEKKEILEAREKYGKAK